VTLWFTEVLDMDKKALIMKRNHDLNTYLHIRHQNNRHKMSARIWDVADRFSEASNELRKAGRIREADSFLGAAVYWLSEAEGWYNFEEGPEEQHEM
jgi:hypothetical protein